MFDGLALVHKNIIKRVITPFQSLFSRINFKVLDADGVFHSVSSEETETLLSAIQKKDVFVESACGGVCACSTCHVVLDPKTYHQLNPPSEKEEDMLEQAYGLTSTSRLSCQVVLNKKLEGALVTIPKATRNFAVDGYKNEPH